MQFVPEDMKFPGCRVDLEYCKNKNGERDRMLLQYPIPCTYVARGAST